MWTVLSVLSFNFNGNRLYVAELDASCFCFVNLFSFNLNVNVTSKRTSYTTNRIASYVRSHCSWNLPIPIYKAATKFQLGVDQFEASLEGVRFTFETAWLESRQFCFLGNLNYRSMIRRYDIFQFPVWMEDWLKLCQILTNS